MQFCRCSRAAHDNLYLGLSLGARLHRSLSPLPRIDPAPHAQFFHTRQSRPLPYLP
jgi:hypothetical protein